MGMIMTKATGQLAFAEDFIKYTKLEIDDIKRAFFKIGFRLNEAVQYRYYELLGYADIYELAQDKFGFGKTTTKNLMAVNRTYSSRFNGDDISHVLPYSMNIAEKFKNFSQAQLVEMLPLGSFERSNISVDMTEKDIRTYKKILKKYEGESEYNYITADPKNAIQEFDASERKDDIPEGQLSIDDVTFYQNDEEELSSASEPTVQSAPIQNGPFDASKYILSKEEFQAQGQAFASEVKPSKRKHVFKNKSEREEFIKNSDNYTTLVLVNDELQLSVRSLEFANGAKIYRTVFSEWLDWKKTYVQRVELCLVHRDYSGEALGENVGKYLFPKTYTLSGTAPTYILDYMTKFKDEI